MQNGKSIFILVLAFLFLYVAFKGCDSDSSQQTSSRAQYEKTPVDILVRDMSNVKNFSIILLDMDYTQGSDKYSHKYNVIKETVDTLIASETEWMTVSSRFFDANVNNMGMEITSKKDGKLSKIAAPAGYSNYVGNQKYGQWKERDGGSFWEFYGKYAFMSSMFRMAMFPVQHSYWNNYNRNYYGRGRSYYGPSSNGRNMYGTNSNYTKSNSTSKWNNKPTSFKNRVRSKVSRSVATAKSKYRSTTTSRQSRNTSRYSRSNTRSRGGSFGK